MVKNSRSESVSGINFIVFNDADKLPFYRFIYFLNLKELNIFRVGEVTAGLYQQNLKDLIKANKNAEAIALIDYMNELLKQDSLFSEVLEYAHCFILLPGENPDLMEPGFKQAKINLAKNDPNVLDFFLAITLPLVKNWRASLKDIISYLKDRQLVQNEGRIIRLIERPTFSNSTGA